VLAKTTNRSQGLRGDIAITTGSLLVEDSLIQAVTDNNVELGKIVIQATGDVTFDFSGLSTNTGFKSAGSRGNDILLAAKNLYLNNGSALVVSTPGDSITGNIDIQVEDRIVLSNLSGIYSYVAPDIIAKGGDINIKARSLTLENGSRLSSEVDNSGSIFAYPPNSVTGRNAGDITINVSDEVKLNGRFDLFTSPVFSEISSKVGNQAVGDGGNIAINTRFLFLANQAKITAGTNGQGNAGAIAIKAESLQIKDGGQFITSSSSSGNAGDITINAHRSLIISGEDTGLFAGTTSNSSGMGGNIYVTSPVFKVLNNGFVSAKNQGWGNGGNLRFEANNLTLQQANITAETIRGRGGNIIIDSDFLSLSKNSQISATANSTGSGGNINIYSDLIVAPTTENNDITANANQGQGGNIRIFSQGIFGLKYNSELTSGNDISASSDLGVDGIVDIQALNIDPNQSDVKFPTEFLDVSQQVTQTCSVQARTNSFVIPGRSGLPLNPNEVLNNTPVWDDNRKRQGGKEQGAGGASPLKKRKRGREQGARGIVQMGIRPHPQLASPQGYESHLIEVGESERHMSGGIRLPKRAAPCSAPLHGRSQGSFPPAPFPPAPCLLLTKASAEGDTGTSPILPESLYREDYQRPLTAPFPLFEQSNTLVEAVDWTIGSDGKVKLLGSKKTVANQTLSCADGNS
jgi:large exoprotein involved in heme utilization and adhesion